MRLRHRVHKPSSNIQCRRLSSSVSIQSSFAKCFAASVGRNRSSSLSEYFCATNFNTLRRNCFGLARFEFFSAFPCFNPAAPAP